VTFIKQWIQKLKDCAVTFTDDIDKLAEELAKHTDNFSFAFLEELFVSSQLVRLRDPDEPLPGEELLRRQVKQLRSQIKPQQRETRRMEWSLVVCLALVVLSVSLGVVIMNKCILIP
jgi:hypothetical protein